MKDLLGMLFITLFTCSVLSIECAAMSEPEDNFRTIVIQKFKPAEKKWRSYVDVHNRCVGKISPLHEEMLRKNYSKTKTHFFNTILIDEKSLIHDAIEQLNQDNSDVNFGHFRFALQSQQEHIAAINYYSTPLGLYAIYELHHDEELIIDILHELFHYGVSVNHEYSNGERLLDAAIAHNLVYVVKYLLEKGANPNTVVDSTKPAPLHAAYRHYNLEIIRMLLVAGAESSVWNEEGYTLLHQACRQNEYPLARLLLLYKADPDSRDLFGSRPIDYVNVDNSDREKNGPLYRLMLNTPKRGQK